MLRRTCSVPGCNDKTNRRYRIPVNEDINKIWIKRIGNPKLQSSETATKNYSICSGHFDNRCIDASSGRLLNFSLPTLCLPGFDGPSTEETCFQRPTPEAPEKVCNLLQQLLSGNVFSPECVSNLKTLFACDVEPQYSQDLDEEGASENVVSHDNMIASGTSITEPDEFNNTLQVQVFSNLRRYERDVGIPGTSRVTMPPFLQEIKLLNSDTNETEEMCRICFQGVKETECNIFYKDAEGETNLTKQIVLCHFPTLDFQMVGRSVICNKCIQILEDYERLKETFRTTEKKFNLMLTEMRTPRNNDKDRVLTVVEDTVNIEIDEKVKTRLKNESATLTNSTGSLRYYVRKDTSVLCEACGKKCKDVRELRRHWFRHKREKLREEQLQEKKALQETPKICEKCGVEVKNANELRKHLETHFPLPCPRCNKIFYRKIYLYTHLRYTHDRKFTVHQCDICGKQFDKHNLIDHMKRHGPRSQFCDICNKAFFTACALRKHKTSHTNDIFACSLCDKVLKYKKSLEKHVQLIHYKDANIVCKICCKPFWKRYDLKKHLIRCHGKENN